MYVGEREGEEEGVSVPPPLAWAREDKDLKNKKERPGEGVRPPVTGKGSSRRGEGKGVGAGDANRG